MQTNKQSSISRGGISLLEVLASVFVVSIGLLGVLAVIPFGAYQVSQAQHAEYASHMLANAAEEILIRNMVPQSSSDKFMWCEPRENPNLPDPAHISRHVDKNCEKIMRGQDDLVYTTYNDKRPDFAGQKGSIQGSGKYTWFFTSQKENEKTAVVDILACYNRVLDDDVQVQTIFTPSLGGGTLTFPDTSHVELLSQTKYVFVTWEAGQSSGGAWCKIVFLDKLTSKIVVTGNLEGMGSTDIQVYIPSGVLYHKRLAGVAVR